MAARDREDLLDQLKRSAAGFDTPREYGALLLAWTFRFVRATRHGDLYVHDSDPLQARVLIPRNTKKYVRSETLRVIRRVQQIEKEQRGDHP